MANRDKDLLDFQQVTHAKCKMHFDFDSSHQKSWPKAFWLFPNGFDARIIPGLFEGAALNPAQDL
jgi:hypothetical protein